MPERTRLSQRGVRALIVLVLAAAGAAALALNFPSSGKAGGPFAGQPLPALFPDSRLATVEQLVAPAEARARRDVAKWLAVHPARDDAAFSAFALRSVGAPPRGAVQQRELKMLHALGRHRTPAGAAASVWLETHGKKAGTTPATSPPAPTWRLASRTCSCLPLQSPQADF